MDKADEEAEFKMERFFTEENILDPIKIEQAGYVSRPYPEYMTSDEMNSVICFLDKKSASLWGFEFGEKPKRLGLSSINDIPQTIFDESHQNLFAAFDGDDLFIWMPQDQEYFIIFGSPNVMKKISNSGIFHYSFRDYAEEEYFSPEKSAQLKEVQRLYEFTAR